MAAVARDRKLCEDTTMRHHGDRRCGASRRIANRYGANNSYDFMHKKLTMRVYPVAAAFYILVSLCLTGCGVDATDPKPPQTTTTVYSFDVAGTVPPDLVTDPERLVVPLQPNNDTVAGAFHLLWDVDSSDPYYVQVWVSNDQTVSSTDDDLLLDTPCGSGTDYKQYCGFLADVTCYFVYDPLYQLTEKLDENGDIVYDVNNQPVMVPDQNLDGSYIVATDRYYLRCPEGSPTVREKEISARLTSVGYNSLQYMIFTACNNDPDAPDCQQGPAIPFVFLNSMP